LSYGTGFRAQRRVLPNLLPQLFTGEITLHPKAPQFQTQKTVLEQEMLCADDERIKACHA
jgi:hypothetical protein